MDLHAFPPSSSCRFFRFASCTSAYAIAFFKAQFEYFFAHRSSFILVICFAHLDFSDLDRLWLHMLGHWNFR